MSSLNDKPSVSKFSSQVFDEKVSKENRYDMILDVIKEFVLEYTDYVYPKLDDSAPTTLKLDCRFYDTVYRKGPLTLRTHEKKFHQYPPCDETPTLSCMPKKHEDDFVLNYIKCAVSLLLLRHNLLMLFIWVMETECTTVCT